MLVWHQACPEGLSAAKESNGPSAVLPHSPAILVWHRRPRRCFAAFPGDARVAPPPSAVSCGIPPRYLCGTAAFSSVQGSFPPPFPPLTPCFKDVVADRLSAER